MLVRRHPAVGAHLVGGRSQDDHVPDDERRHVVLVTLLEVGHDRVPNHTPARGVDREQMAIDCGPEQGVSGDRQAFVDLVRVGIFFGSSGRESFQVLLAGDSVERHGLQSGARIHDAVDHQRRVLHLVLTVRVLRVERTVGPLQLKRLDVGPIDLGQRAVAVARIVARVAEPVLRLTVGADKTVVRHVRRRRGSQQREQDHDACVHGGHLQKSLMLPAEAGRSRQSCQE